LIEKDNLLVKREREEKSQLLLVVVLVGWLVGWLVGCLLHASCSVIATT